LETLEDRRVLSVDLLSGGLPEISAAPGDAASFAPVISADGRFAAFASAADNLVTGDTNGVSDVFVKDLQTGAIQRASTSGIGAEANGPSTGPSISRDGRYVAFQSEATNLVALDLNNSTDVFIKDLLSGAIQRASTDRLGTEAAGASYGASISDDGQYVAFVSVAENLVGGDVNNDTDVFVKHLPSGTVILASSDSTGGPANDSSSNAELSGNGQFVTFESIATNLVPGDINEFTDVFVKDIQSGTIRRASVDRMGTEADSGSGAPALSSDGRYVAFVSAASNLVPADTNVHSDLFVKDLQSGEILRVNTDRNGNQANNDAADAVLSGDGRYVAFTSSASNLVANDTNAGVDVFVKDLRSGAIVRANTGPSGAQANSSTWSLGMPSLNADGRYVVFSSDATNLEPIDTNGVSDVFLKDLKTGDVVLVSGTAPHDATPGLYDPVASVWYLKNDCTGGMADATFGFGAPGAGWLPVVGDWNGDGVDTVGLYDPAASVFYLRNANTTGMADLTFGFGAAGAGWLPVVGDWNGDGIDTVGLYDPAASLFYLRNTNTIGMADVAVPFGPPGGGWSPVAGDWDSDGRDTVGLYDGAASTWYLTDSLIAPVANHVFGYGQPGAGWTALAGDWNVDRCDTVGEFDPAGAVWYLANNHGPQDPVVFGFGLPGGGWLPVAGDWDGLAALDSAAVDAAFAALGQPLADGGLDRLTG
jgi:Tol biopolymer transport system component